MGSNQAHTKLLLYRYVTLPHLYHNTRHAQNRIRHIMHSSFNTGSAYKVKRCSRTGRRLDGAERKSEETESCETHLALEVAMPPLPSYRSSAASAIRSSPTIRHLIRAFVSVPSLGQRERAGRPSPQHTRPAATRHPSVTKHLPQTRF